MIRDFSMVEQNYLTWELNVHDYETKDWGTAVNGFKVPATIFNRFKNADGTFNKEKAFIQLATTYINALVASNEILRQTHFDFLDKDTRENLKKCVYNAIEYSCLNRQVWEIARDTSVAGSNFNIQAQSTDWRITEDMIGKKAYNYLIASCLDDYRWVSEKTLYAETKDGNIKIIGKTNIQDIPNLADVVY